MRKRGELATDNLIKRCEPRAVRERQVSRWCVFLFNERSDITSELTRRREFNQAPPDQL